MNKDEKEELKKKAKREKIKAFKSNANTKWVASHLKMMYTIVHLLMIGALVLTISFKWDLLIPITLLGAIVFILSLIFKDLTDEKMRSKIPFHFKTGLLLLASNLIAYAIGSGFKGTIPNPILTVLTFIASFITAIIMLKLFRQKKFIERIEDMMEKNFFDEMLGEEIKDGDAILGVDLETGKPVVLPYADRFLHMLALGATGTGKTAMTLTPMAWRDINNPNMGFTVIEPKGDYAEQVWAMTQIANERNQGKEGWTPRKCVFFDPVSTECPIFNPLFGPEVSVIENMATTFRMFGEGSSQFFQDNNETLLRNALKVLKRWEIGHPNGREVTLVDLSSLLNGGKTGVEILEDFSRVRPRTSDQKRENEEIYLWFKNEYLAGKSGEKGAPKTYEHTSAVRTQLTKLNSNEYLRRVLNPGPDDEGKERLDFAKALEERQVLAISTAQGDLQDLGKFLGYFIILNFQSAVFNRPGTVDTRPPHILQIDEFQTYANMGFANMLTQGRSYRVSSVLATQNRSLIGANAGKDAKNFMDLVSTNARNVVIYPGANYEDASYYSRQFGEVTEREIERGISRPVQSLAYGLDGLGKRPSESIKEVEKTKARFSANDITYRPFGEVTIGIIKNNSIQAPVAAKLSFIEYGLKKEMDKMIEEYQENRKKGWINLRKEEEKGLKPANDVDYEHEFSEKNRQDLKSDDILINLENGSLNFDENFIKDDEKIMLKAQTDAIFDANRGELPQKTSIVRVNTSKKRYSNADNAQSDEF